MLTCSKRERTALAVFCALTAGALLITGLFLLLRPGLFQIPAAADVESMEVDYTFGGETRHKEVTDSNRIETALASISVPRRAKPGDAGSTVLQFTLHKKVGTDTAFRIEPTARWEGRLYAEDGGCFWAGTPGDWQSLWECLG